MDEDPRDINAPAVHAGARHHRRGAARVRRVNANGNAGDDRPRVGFRPRVGERERACVQYMDVVSQHNSQFVFGLYEFDDIIAYNAKPEDDLEQIIRTYAKISFDPKQEYVIDKQIVINSPCYLIGNSAKFKLTTETAGFYFKERNNAAPVLDMDLNTIVDIIFEREGGSCSSVVFSNCQLVVHGCVFKNISGICVNGYMKMSVRGCYFENCYYCVRQGSTDETTVYSCVFENCVIGVYSKGFLQVKHCNFMNLLCSVALKGAGNISYNSFSVSNREDIRFDSRLCVCHGVHVLPLGNIHIVGSLGLRWPAFIGNTLTRIKIYLGQRLGVFHPERSSFLWCTIGIDSHSLRKICLHGVYDSTLKIKKFARKASGYVDFRVCVCGETHVCPLLNTINVTCRTKPDRTLESVESVEFLSDAE